jgi:hypothetical protein
MSDRTERVPEWGDSPAHVSAPAATIFKIGGGQAKDFVILSSKVVGVYTHYVGGRTLPCTGKNGDCWIDHRKTSTRWQGWVAVSNLHSVAQWGYLCLTQTAFQRNEYLVGLAENLRGLQLKVGRAGGEKNSLLFCSATGRYALMNRLPAEPDVKAFLMRLWGQVCIPDYNGWDPSKPSRFGEPLPPQVNPRLREGA